MALAPYFSKNALAIQHILKKGNFQQFEILLNEHVVEIAFDKDIHNHEGRCALDLLIKLVARLYPRLKFRDLDASSSKEIQECITKAKAINSLIEITDDTPTVSVVIGRTVLESNNQVFYIGSKEWRVLLSDNHPVGSGKTILPFAAGVAACIGAANVFRFVFKELLRKATLDTFISFSLLDAYNHDGQEILCKDLGMFHLAGVGAIGNGCLWALSNLRGVKGELIVVDHQKITLSNIQRYIEVLEKDKKVHKGIIAARVLRNSQIQVKQINATWTQFISRSKDYHKEMVLTALDTAKDRIAVQASLPRVIFNGYTDDGILGVARHLNFLDQACINCVYTPKGSVPNRSETIARDLGIPEITIRNRVYLNSKVDDQLLSSIATANHIPFDDIKKFKGVPIETFYSEFVCAGVLLQIKGTSSIPDQTIEAPLAFQSALAGILMVADLYLYKAGIQPIYNRTHYNPMVPIKPGINFIHHTVVKEMAAQCICCDPIYRQVYADKWK